MAGMSSVDVRKNEAESRYEAVVDGEVAGFLTYEPGGSGAVDLTHTVVEGAHEGKGVGSALAKAALDDLRDQGKQVVATCSFVRGYIEKHPVYAALTGAKGSDEPKGIGGGGSF